MGKFVIQRLGLLALMVLVVMSLFALTAFAEVRQSPMNDGSLTSVPMPQVMVAQQRVNALADEEIQQYVGNGIDEEALREKIKERVRQRLGDQYQQLLSDDKIDALINARVENAFKRGELRGEFHAETHTQQVLSQEERQQVKAQRELRGEQGQNQVRENQKELIKKQVAIAREQAKIAREQAKRAREIAQQMRAKYLNERMKYVHVKADYEKAKDEWLKIANLRKKAVQEGRPLFNISDEEFLNHAKTFVLKSIDRMITHLDLVITLIEKEQPENADELIAKLNEAKATLEDIRDQVENATSYEELKTIGRDLRKKWSEEQTFLKRATGRTAVKKMVGITNVVDTFSNRLEKIREKLQEEGYDTSSLDEIMDEINTKLAQAKTLRERAKTAWQQAEKSNDFQKRAQLAEKYIHQANDILKELRELIREAVKEIKQIKGEHDHMTSTTGTTTITDIVPTSTLSNVSTTTTEEITTTTVNFNNETLPNGTSSTGQATA